MDQQEAQAAFNMLLESLKHNATRTTSIGAVDKIVYSVTVNGSEVVDLFVARNNCLDHRDHLISLANPQYVLDREKWRAAKGI